MIGFWVFLACCVLFLVIAYLFKNWLHKITSDSYNSEAVKDYETKKKVIENKIKEQTVKQTKEELNRIFGNGAKF